MSCSGVGNDVAQKEKALAGLFFCQRLSAPVGHFFQSCTNELAVRNMQQVCHPSYKVLFMGIGMTIGVSDFP